MVAVDREEPERPDEPYLDEDGRLHAPLLPEDEDLEMDEDGRLHKVRRQHI